MTKRAPTIAQRFDSFNYAMVRLVSARFCACELPTLEPLLARAAHHFDAAQPHLAQLERGCTRSDLGALQCALIDKAGLALFVVAIAIANEVGMSLTKPDQLERGRIAAFEMLAALGAFVSDGDADTQAAFMTPVPECGEENARDHAS